MPEKKENVLLKEMQLNYDSDIFGIKLLNFFNAMDLC